MLRKTDEVRHAFASLINASDEEVGLLYATSEGENVVTDALDLKRGENVVIDDLAYPSTSIIHKRLEQTKGIEVRIVRQRAGGTYVEDFARLVDNRTRLISVTWVSNLNGFRHDMKALADLAHAHGALLYTDAIQAVGMGPIDVRAEGVDFLCCGGYKWLMAGFGVAPFFVRRELLDRVRPDRAGWHVEKSLGGYRYQPFKTAKKYEFASLAFGDVYLLGAALEYLQRVGLQRIEAHTVGLTNRLRAGLDRSRLRRVHAARHAVVDPEFLREAVGSTPRQSVRRQPRQDQHPAWRDRRTGGTRGTHPCVRGHLALQQRRRRSTTARGGRETARLVT